MHHISAEDFRLIIGLPTSKRVDQCINSVTFKFVNNTCSLFREEISARAAVYTRYVMDAYDHV